MALRSKETLASVQYDVPCASCADSVRPPGAVCEKGHSICNRCRPLLERCPSCDRNFQGAGSYVVRTNSRLSVKDKSLTAECGCPMSLTTGKQCPWTGKLGEIKKHIFQTHDKKIADKTGKFSMPFTNVTHQASYSLVISTLGEVFMRKAQIQDENFYLVVLYIGPEQNAAKYKYSFTISRKKSVEIISICHQTRSFLEKCDDIYKSGNCVKLHYDVVSDFLLETSELPNVMEISKV